MNDQYINRSTLKNRLCLFTSEFPYGHLEVFIETEIKYLSKSFDEVYLISHAKEKVTLRN